MTTRHFTALLLVATFAHTLSGCGGAEERKAEYVIRGKKLFEESNFDKARVEFKNALQIDPKAAQAYFYLGQIEESKQNWQEAFGLYSKSVELDPNQFQAKTRLARIYLMAKQPDKALEQLDSVLRGQPRDVEARIVKAEVANSRGDRDAAELELTRVIADDPSRVDAYLALGVIYEQKKDPDPLARILAKGLEANPGNAKLLLGQARFSLQQKQTDKAEAIIKQLIEIEPGNIEHRALLAGLYIDSKRLDDADQVLRQAIQATPKDVRRYGLLTDFLVRRGKSEEAVELLNQAVKSYPDEASLRFALGQLHERLKQSAKAETVYAEIIDKIDNVPDQLKAKDRLAYLAAAQGNSEKANQLVEEVLKESPQDQQALLLQGKMALAGKDAQKAIASFRSILKNQPHSVEVLTLLAAANQQDDKLALAQESLEKAAAVNPTDFAPYKRLLEFLVQQKNFTSALEKSDEYLKLNPKNLEALNAKADVLAAENQTAALEQLLLKMRSDYPDQFIASFRLGQLYRIQKKYPAALAEFEASQKKAGENLNPLKEIVATYVDMNQPNKALARLKQLIAEKPQQAGLYELLAVYHANQKQEEEAIKAFKKAIEINPKWPVPYSNLASLYAQQGKCDLAIKLYDDALTIFPDNFELLLNLANLHVQAKDTPGAIGRYQQILAKNPDHLAALNNLASLLSLDPANQENLEQAKKLGQRLPKSGEPALLDTQAWISHLTGDQTTALQLMQQIIQKAPDEPIFNYHFGMIALKNGDQAAAKTHLEKAVASGKNFAGLEDAREALKNL